MGVDMDQNAVLSAIITDLRSNITDPISSSNRGEWIHRGSLDDIGKTPAVYIEPGPTPGKFEPIGGQVQGYISAKIHVVIKSKDTGTSPLDSVLKTDDDELHDDLCQAIINRMDGRHYGGGTCNFVNQTGAFPIDNARKGQTITFTVTQG